MMTSFWCQSEFSDVFQSHVNKLASRSDFIGLRNYGSIKALKTYLDESLHEKLIFQPCPTTILNHLYPENKKSPYKEGRKQLALNMAFDRHHLRFKNEENYIIIYFFL